MKKFLSIFAFAGVLFMGSANSAMAQHRPHHLEASAPRPVVVVQKESRADKACRVLNAIGHAMGEAAHAQQGAYNPNTGTYRFYEGHFVCDANQPDCHITGVEKHADGTAVHFHYVAQMPVDAYLSTNTVLRDNASGLTFNMTASQNLFTDRTIHLQPGQGYDFTVFFPAVTYSCKSIDVVEQYPGMTRTFHVEGLSHNYEI